MFGLGDTVLYRPHGDHEHLKEHPCLAAIVGQLHWDGAADLFLLVPGKPGEWVDNVHEGEGPHTFRSRTPAA